MNIYQAIDAPIQLKFKNEQAKSSNRAEFPNERLFKVAVIVHKKLSKIPQIERTRCQELYLLWATAIYDFGRKKFADLLATEFWLDAARENVQKNTLRNSSCTFPCRSHIKCAIYFCRRNLEFPESKLNSEDRRNFPWAKAVLDLNSSLITEVLSSTDKPAEKPTKASGEPPKAGVQPSKVNEKWSKAKVEPSKAKAEPPKADAKPSIVLGSTKQIPVLISDAKTKQKPGKPKQSAISVKVQQVKSPISAPSVNVRPKPLSQMPYSWNQFSAARDINVMPVLNSFPTPYMYNSAPVNFTYADVQPNIELPMTTPMSNFQMPFMCNSNFLNDPNFDVPASMSNFQSTSTYDTPTVPNWESYAPNPAGTEVLSTRNSASDAYKPNTPAEPVLVPCKTSLVATVRPTKSFKTRLNVEDFVNPTNPSANVTNSAKRCRLTEEVDNLDDIPEDLVVGLVDRNNADGEINPMHWETIKTKIMPIFHEVLRSKSKSNNHRVIDLRNAHEDRIKLFGLDSHRTLKLFQNTLQLMSQLWPDSNITVMPKRLLPRRPRYRAFIPAEPSDPETIMTIIKVSNPALPTYNWKVVQINEENKGQRAIGIATNEESFAPLLEQDMVINYAFGFTRLKMYKVDRVPGEKAAITAKFTRHNDNATEQRLSSPQKPRERYKRDADEDRADMYADRMKHENFALLTQTILNHWNQMTDESFEHNFDPEEYRGWF